MSESATHASQGKHSAACLLVHGPCLAQDVEVLEVAARAGRVFPRARHLEEKELGEGEREEREGGYWGTTSAPEDSQYLAGV